MDLGIDPSDINTGSPSTGKGELRFNKDSAAPTTATITVVAPFSGTGWKVTGFCPQNANNQAGVLETSNTTNGSGERTQIFEIGTNVNDGDLYRFTLYGVVLEVLATSNDDSLSIALKLMNLINSQTVLTWAGNSQSPSVGVSGFPPSATVNGVFLTVVLNLSDQVSLIVI